MKIVAIMQKHTISLSVMLFLITKTALSLSSFSGQRMLEEFQAHLKTEATRREEGKGKTDKTSKILVNVKAGVEHLADKLQHIKAVSINIIVNLLHKIQPLINAMKKDKYESRDHAWQVRTYTAMSSI